MPTEEGITGAYQYVVDMISEQIWKLWRWLKDFFTSFIGFHYCYIMSLVLVLSWIMYPERNMLYIDAFFEATAVVTATGLTSMVINELKLYQQIVIIIFPLLCHPLVINTGMVILRLHFFEKRFENINQRSRLQSKARRFATRTNTEMRRTHHAGEPARPRAEDLVRSLNLMQNHVKNKAERKSGNATPLYIERNSDSSLSGNVNDLDEGEGPPTVVRPPADVERGIDFQDFDSNKSIISKDSYGGEDYDEGEGPAVVVKSPMEIENDGNHTPIRRFTGASQTSQANKIKFEPLPHPTHNNRGEDVISISSESPSAYKVEKAKSIASVPRRESLQRTRTMRSNYLSWSPTMAGRSTFVNLTQEQKEELGGLEYRALKLLVPINVCYYFGIILLSWIVMIPWCAARKSYAEQYRAEGFNPEWNAIFTGTASFLNLGILLSPQGMTMYDASAYITLWSAFFILAGNICQPIFLRFIIWVLFKFSPTFGATHEALGFLLDHPRRCFLLLFPVRATSWLLFVVIALNVTDLVIFLALDFNGPAVDFLERGYRVMCGLYQAVSTRTAGFNILAMNLIHPSVQLSYIVMMYISAFPVAMSVRQTNVYEEQTLGVFYGGEEDVPDDRSTRSNRTNHTTRSDISHMHRRQSPLFTHIQRQLSHDIWYLTLACFIIMICESSRVVTNDITFLMILFECVSAYGNVGLSLGYKSEAYSLSGEFNVVAKLVLCALMVRGRHRGLPYRVDRAILLKSDVVEAHDDLQQDVARKYHILEPTEYAEDDNLFQRFNTTASRLRRTATTRLRPAATRFSTLTRKNRSSSHRPRAMSLDLGKRETTP